MIEGENDQNGIRAAFPFVLDISFAFGDSKLVSNFRYSDFELPVVLARPATAVRGCKLRPRRCRVPPFFPARMAVKVPGGRETKIPDSVG